MNYSEKLRDPRWQKKRLEIMERDGFECQNCFCDDKTLHVHHQQYEYGRDPWDYQDDDLITYCEDCHKRLQEKVKKIKSIIEKSDENYIDTIYGILQVLCAENTSKIHVVSNSCAWGIAMYARCPVNDVLRNCDKNGYIELWKIYALKDANNPHPIDLDKAPF